MGSVVPLLSAVISFSLGDLYFMFLLLYRIYANSYAQLLARRCDYNHFMCTHYPYQPLVRTQLILLRRRRPGILSRVLRVGASACEIATAKAFIRRSLDAKPLCRERVIRKYALPLPLLYNICYSGYVA